MQECDAHIVEIGRAELGRRWLITGETGSGQGNRRAGRCNKLFAARLPDRFVAINCFGDIPRHCMEIVRSLATSAAPFHGRGGEGGVISACFELADAGNAC